MPQPGYPSEVATWCLSLNENLPKEIATHFVDLPVNQYAEIPNFLLSVPDLHHKPTESFVAYITSLKAISELRIALSKFESGP